MSAGLQRGLLSIGVFLIIIVVSILLYWPLQVIPPPNWTLIFPLIIALYGVWMLALAAIRMSNPQKYERGAFGTSSWGLLLIAIGGSWFVYTYNVVYSIAIILLMLGALAIIAALKRK